MSLGPASDNTPHGVTWSGDCPYGNPQCPTCHPKSNDIELPVTDPKKWGRWSPSTAQPGPAPTYSLDYKTGWFDGFHAAKAAP